MMGTCCVTGQVSCPWDKMEDEYGSDNVSMAEAPSMCMDLYTLEEMNLFLPEMFEKPVKVEKIFQGH